MSDIQQARDVLAKWRKSQSWFPGPWGIRNELPGRANWSDVIFDTQGDSLFTHDEEGCDEFSPTHDAGTDPTVAMLIVGTAGNPELLGAIDGLLEAAIDLLTENASVRRATIGVERRLVNHAQAIAAAIIAADERMNA